MNAATQRQLARAALLALILLLIFPTILTAISVVATGAVHAAGEQPVAQATATRRATATPRVSLAGGAVDTFLDVQIEPSANIAHVTKLLGATVEETLREQVGVTAIRKPTVRISYDEMAARPVPVRRAPTPPPDLRPQHTPAFESGAPVDTHGVGDDARPPEAPRFVSPNDEESPNA